jgi:hypothetical protein
MAMRRRFSSERGDRFRITQESANGCVVLRIEGWLSPVSLDLIEAECGKVRARGEAAVLELSGLRSLGAAEAQRLAHLGRSGVELTGASVFVAALLRDGSAS